MLSNEWVHRNLAVVFLIATVVVMAFASPFPCFAATRSASERLPGNALVAQREFTSVRIHLPRKASALTKRISGILATRIKERSLARITTSGKAGLNLYLDISPGIGYEGYRIENRPDGGITISGNDERGLLFGVGKFLHTSAYKKEGLIPSSWRGVSVPAKPVRGMYFATHFRNYYEEAPIERVTRYVEDMALWGTNTFLVWFGIEAYDGIDDPKGQAVLSRLRALLKTAKDLGLDASLGCVANDGYKNSPVELRADVRLDRYGYRPVGDLKTLPNMGTELCPSKPGVPELQVSYCQDKFDAFRSIGLDYWFIAAYDNGGCTCEKCAPWGINGFLRMAELEARAFRRAYPKGKVIISTSYFDLFIDGEWSGITNKFNAQKPDWVDYIMTNEYGVYVPQYVMTHGSPGGLPLLNFPEISMYQTWPAGNFGANPLPGYVQSLWDAAKTKYSGGFPYSEGIYEDMNKVMIAQLYWEPDKTAHQAMRDYISYYFSPSVVEGVSRAMKILERNLPRSRTDLDGVTLITLRNTKGAEEVYRLIAAIDAELPASVRSSWRWRIVYLRALIDSELVKNRFRVSSRCQAAFQELTTIYYAENAFACVSTPLNVLGVLETEQKK